MIFGVKSSRQAGQLQDWSERQDLNLRPLVPQTSALPGCATLRQAVTSAREIRRGQCLSRSLTPTKRRPQVTLSLGRMWLWQETQWWAMSVDLVSGDGR